MLKSLSLPVNHRQKAPDTYVVISLVFSGQWDDTSGGNSEESQADNGLGTIAKENESISKSRIKQS